MIISRTAVGILAAACVAGGAAGSYLVTRSEVPGLEARAMTEQPLEDVVLPAVEDPAPAAQVAEAPRPAPAPAPAPAAAAPRPAPPAPRPAGQAPVPSPVPALPDPEEPFAPVPPAVAPQEPARWVPSAPPAPVFDELVVPANAVIGLQIETTVSSETAQVEDRVTARVTRDVRSGDRVAIPAGARLEGTVTEVDRGGRVRERALLGIRFTSAVLADGTRLPLVTETVYREGESPSGESAAKIGGGAIGGAILGGILGGARGAAIGGSAGAGAGTAAVLAGGRNPATLQAGTPITVRIERPVTVIVER